jgi:hypothetical protein
MNAWRGVVSLSIWTVMGTHELSGLEVTKPPTQKSQSAGPSSQAT